MVALSKNVHSFAALILSLQENITIFSFVSQSPNIGVSTQNPSYHNCQTFLEIVQILKLFAKKIFNDNPKKCLCFTSRRPYIEVQKGRNALLPKFSVRILYIYIDSQGIPFYHKMSLSKITHSLDGFLVH